MEFLTLLAAPILTALIAPILLEYIKKRIDKAKEERDRKQHKGDKNQELADQLRDELREENVDLKKVVDQLEQRILEQSGASKEIERWQSEYYKLRKANRRLQFDLALVQKELELLKEKYAEYLEVKARAERECRRTDDDSG